MNISSIITYTTILYCTCIELQGTLTAKNERVQDLEDELELVKSELVTLMESSSRSESNNMYYRAHTTINKFMQLYGSR